jgi:hypothetical protein
VLLAGAPTYGDWVSWPDDPLELLAGPRGRRLCLEVVSPVTDRSVDDEPQCPAWFTVWAEHKLARDSDLAAELAAMIAVTDLDQVAARSDPLSLFGPLVLSVDSAMYWQPADEVDEVLRSPVLADVLAPVARAVTASPAAAWWSAPLDRERQQYADFPLDGAPTGARRVADPPALTGATSRIETWRAEALDDENRAAERSPDVTAPWSGHWWSSPIPGPLSTTRSLPNLGAAELCLVEDTTGPREASCWPLRVSPAARVLEITDRVGWTALVARYPLDMTKSRRHDWWRVAGVDSRWLIPDYAAVAADYDALHLTVGGYLTTVGRALPVEVASTANATARTLLAGWNPDETYWLADMLELAGSAVGWVSPDGDPLAWTPAPGSPHSA